MSRRAATPATAPDACPTATARGTSRRVMAAPSLVRRAVVQCQLLDTFRVRVGQIGDQRLVGQL